MLNDTQQKKQKLRSYYSNKRKQIFGENKLLKDTVIVKKLISLNSVQNAKALFVYLPLKYEINTHELVNWAVSNNKTVAAPVCDEVGNKMQFYSFDTLSGMAKGRFGIPEPKPLKERLVIPDKGSVCLLPGLLFDKNGHRLGYGKGFYDRYLENYSVLKIGLCYEECLCDALPYDDNDIAADIVITEQNEYYQNKGTD